MSAFFTGGSGRNNKQNPKRFWRCEMLRNKLFSLKNTHFYSIFKHVNIRFNLEYISLHESCTTEAIQSLLSSSNMFCFVCYLQCPLSFTSKHSSILSQSLVWGSNLWPSDHKSGALPWSHIPHKYMRKNTAHKNSQLPSCFSASSSEETLSTSMKGLSLLDEPSSVEKKNQSTIKQKNKQNWENT